MRTLQFGEIERIVLISERNKSSFITRAGSFHLKNNNILLKIRSETGIHGWKPCNELFSHQMRR